MSVRTFFNSHPVFRVEEFAAFLAARDSTNPKTREASLAHYLQAGRILRVRRGLYVTVPEGSDHETYPVDPYLVAGRVTADAVLACHTAMEFHGKAHSVREHFTYLSASMPRPLSFRGCRYRGVPFPKQLRESHQEMVEVQTHDRLGLAVRVTSLERTFVDMLHRPDLSGGWEEIWRSLESVTFFDLDKVVDYALLLENSTTIARVGFFLEQHREGLMVEESHLERLRGHRPKAPHYMSRGKRAAGHLVRGWNLVVPVDVLERSWEREG